MPQLPVNRNMRKLFLYDPTNPEEKLPTGWSPWSGSQANLPTSPYGGLQSVPGVNPTNWGYASPGGYQWSGMPGQSAGISMGPYESGTAPGTYQMPKGARQPSTNTGTTVKRRLPKAPTKMTTGYNPFYNKRGM